MVQECLKRVECVYNSPLLNSQNDVQLIFCFKAPFPLKGKGPNDDDDEYFA